MALAASAVQIAPLGCLFSFFLDVDGKQTHTPYVISHVICQRHKKALGEIRRISFFSEHGRDRADPPQPRVVVDVQQAHATALRPHEPLRKWQRRCVEALKARGESGLGNAAAREGHQRASDPQQHAWPVAVCCGVLRCLALRSNWPTSASASTSAGWPGLPGSAITTRADGDARSASAQRLQAAEPVRFSAAVLCSSWLQCKSRPPGECGGELRRVARVASEQQVARRQRCVRR